MQTREAEVDGILTGKSPLEKKLPLFPAKATHQQLLGLVQRPSHPDKPAPMVPREKWLGNNIGWEGKANNVYISLSRVEIDSQILHNQNK